MANISTKRAVRAAALSEMEKHGNCDLFLIGLKEVGILDGKEWWWDCELFEIGLQELGLAA